jgi:hypothetical protein
MVKQLMFLMKEAADTGMYAILMEPVAILQLLTKSRRQNQPLNKMKGNG